MNIRLFSIITGLVLLSVSLLQVNACSRDTPETTMPVTTTSTTAPATQSAQRTEVESEYITIIDQTDKAVQVPRDVQRIVTLPVPFPAVFYAVAGSGEKIVGMHPTSMSAVESSILGVMAPELLEANTSFVKTGFEVNIEELIKLEPDVVFQWASQPKEIEKMEAVGIPVIALNYGGQEELDGWFKILGQLLGREDQAPN
jgi:iron complex transport system substrate-binding protein